jgi:hypothetical protein
MKSICLLGLVLCAGCGSANASGLANGGSTAKGEIAKTTAAAPVVNASPQSQGDKPSAKDGGGGW